ncbi:hypothetical protein N7495_004459 [Penicillium taxi]|uniref:uncharacterized protein n=1 Tax=Penicillium taxi TaxID=168475 RepID=UPI0025451827|nr:uncharacterized protein N7495_004459 [Penicillium taxi]KAJ5899715.1 hypothetical protein N7495_004459 [Penicillium taxi]
MERDILPMTDPQLNQHMESLVHHVLLPMRARKTPASIPLSPRTRVQREVENQYSKMIFTAKRLQRLKEDCLLRDDNRCAISLVSDEKKMPTGFQGDTCDTQCAHILPFLLSTFNNDPKARERPEVWTAIIWCFPILDDLAVLFTHNDINDHRNLISMDKEVHDRFGQFKFSLVATGLQDQYTLHLWQPRYLRHVRGINIVQFSAHGTRFDLPSRELIEIHHIMAQILHASGRAQWIERVLKDIEDTCVLAHDGSTNVTDMLWGTELALMSELIQC